MQNTINEIFDIINSRKNGDKSVSYTAKLFFKGKNKIAQKVGEEAVETVIAGLNEGKKELISESADLLFHLMIFWAACGVTPKDVAEELNRRREKGKNPDKPQQI